MKRLEKRRSEGEKERERERETKRKREGDEGAFPVRSVEKGDRGGYGVVAWVCDGTGSCRRDERGWRERRREWARRSPKGWKETNDEIRRGPGELDRERKRARVEVNE